MKKFLLILLLAANLFALEISKSKTFTEFLEPSFQSAPFGISYKADYDYKIESKFRKIIHKAEKSSICKGGKYYIRPSYRYIDKKRVSDGFRSNIRFTCEFKDIKDYENLLDKIKKENLKIEQGQINYKITQEQKDKAKTKLEKEAFIYAKDYLDRLDQFFGKCVIKSINLSGNKIHPVSYRAMAMESSSLKTTVTSPLKDDIKFNLNVDYIFKCTQ